MASGRADETFGTGLAGFRRREDGAWPPRAGEGNERRGRVSDLMVTRLVGLGCAFRGAPNPACRRKKWRRRRRRGGGRRRRGGGRRRTNLALMPNKRLQIALGGSYHLLPPRYNALKTTPFHQEKTCGERYNENIVMDPGTVDIYPSSRIPKNLHYLVKPIYCSKSLITKDLSGSGDTLKEKGFRITTNPQTLTSVLQFSSDDEVRKMVYIRGNSVPHANVDVLKRLISARHELAQIMGSRSYAEFSVKPNMAVSPKVVTSFLLEMSKMVQAKSIEERKLVMKFKREKCGRSDGDLRPWDETYYMTMMKSSSYKLDASVVGSYFSLSNCIEGLKVLVQSLFGATFRIIPLAPGESWDPHVLKLSLDHPEEVFGVKICV
ncbi:Mitochondrial intermediate peptidase, mitochondrial [Glycine soja]|uniref:Mitochondrial intermediate peptidase, mitochondrial n=1 Tax=Glycine soja TaxID=3848 RepID=A0A445KZ01_GLYSO|nr:Mitochondrial intermediate peptidase, mitochondrial [Glycine soja]